MSGALSTFTVTTAAATGGGSVVNLIGNDGSASQTYTMTYSSSIADGDPFSLTNGSKTITFINKSGGALGSANAVINYLRTTCPVDTVLRKNTLLKATQLRTLLAASDTNAASNVAKIRALLSAVSGSDIATRVINSLNLRDQGVSVMPASVTSLTVSTTAASDGAGGINIVFASGNYHLASGSLSPTAPGGTFTLTANSGADSGKSITFFNRSMSALTTASDYITYLSTQYPNTTAIGTADVDASLLTTPTGNAVNDLATLRSYLVASLGATTQSDLDTLGQALTGANASSGSRLQARIAAQTTAIKNGATQLNTAISDVNAVLGGSGTIAARISALNSSLDGVTNMSGLTSFTVSTAATNGAGTVTIVGNDGSAGRSYSVDTSISGINIGDGTGGTTSIANGATVTLTHSGSGNTITFVNNSGSPITSAANLATYLAGAHPVGAIMKSTANTKLTALSTSLLATPTGIIATDLGTLAARLVASPTGVLETDMDALSTALFSNTSYSSSLTTQVISQSNTIDNGLSSLPGGGTYAQIGTAAADDISGGVNIAINGSSANGTYNLPSGTITGGITNGSSFTLANGPDHMVLVNRSGSTISTQAEAIAYLKSMYPVTSTIALGLSDKVSSLNTMAGGTATSIRARLAAIDAKLLTTPSGVLATDLDTLANLINGSNASSASTLQARTGAPTVNGSGSNLFAMIGGAASDLASRIGDPVTGTTGLASLIRNNDSNALTTIADFDCSTFDSATSIYAQISSFLNILSQANSGAGAFAATTHIQIPVGNFSSLRTVLAALGHD